MNQTSPLVREDLANLIEQKKAETATPSLWDQLSLAQEFSVCSLSQFGYVLTGIRETALGKIAILQLNQKIATIQDNGYINTNPGYYN